MNIRKALYEELKELFEVIGDTDPLTYIPESSNRLYCIKKGFDNHYFKTSEEREEWIAINKPSVCRKVTLVYIGELAGKNNVIKEIGENKSYRLLSIESREKYQVYNSERSSMKQEYIWDNYYGNITDMYKAFENKNVKENVKEIVKVG